ncbi:MAG: circadian clock protein KaiC, partial [Anaerolineales bacterium]
REQEVESRQLELERKRMVLEAQITALRAEFAVQESASMKIIGQEQAQEAQLAQERTDMGLSRKADVASSKRKGDVK